MSISYAHLNKINNLIMIGVPNQGASKAWGPLHDNWVVDPAFQMVLSKIINRAYQKVLNNGLVISGPDYNISLASITAPQCLDTREVCFINQYVPTARALLATYDFIDFGFGLTNVNNISEARNSLLLDLNAGDPNAFADKVMAKPTIIYGTNGGDTPTTVVAQVGPTFAGPGFAPIAGFAGRPAMTPEATRASRPGHGAERRPPRAARDPSGETLGKSHAFAPFTPSSRGPGELGAS